MHFVGDLKVSDGLSIVSSILQLISYSPEASLLLLGSAPVWLPVSWLMWEAQCWGCVFVIPKMLMWKMLMGQVAMVAVFFRKSNLLVNHLLTLRFPILFPKLNTLGPLWLHFGQLILTVASLCFICVPVPPSSPFSFSHQGSLDKESASSIPHTIVVPNLKGLKLEVKFYIENIKSLLVYAWKQRTLPLKNKKQTLDYCWLRWNGPHSRLTCSAWLLCTASERLFVRPEHAVLVGIVGSLSKGSCIWHTHSCRGPLSWRHLDQCCIHFC